MGDESALPFERPGSEPPEARTWARIAPEILLGVFQQSPDGILIGHPDGLILYANEKACEIFGCSEAELRRAGRAGVSYPDDPLVPIVIEERTRTGRSKGLVPLRRMDGTPFMAEAASVVFETPEGEQRTVIIIRDVTEQVRNERRLAAYDDIAEALLAATDFSQVMQLVAHHSRLIFHTDVAIISTVAEDGTVEVIAVEGESARHLLGRRYSSGGTVHEVIENKDAVIIDDFSAVAIVEDGRQLKVGPAMALPVLSNEDILGVLFLGRTTGIPYTAKDLDAATQFARRLGVVMGVGQARAERERLQKQTADQLQTALNTRIIIEQAKGIIAATRNVEIEEAFERLRAYARSHSTRIHEVATRVVQRTLLP
jgi:PAS domain S-box-containing protein